MDTVGAFQLTAGTAFRVTTSRMARWVTLRNDSPYYIGIMAGPASPTTPTAPTSYPKTIPPWSGDNFDTQQNLQLYDGTVYLYPYVPGGVSAYTVPLAQRSLVSIDTYAANESPPPPYAGAPAATTAQPGFTLSGLFTAVGSGSGTLFLAGSNFAPTATQLANQQAICFLSAFELSGDNTSAALISFDISVVFMSMTAGLAIITTGTLWRTSFGCPATNQTAYPRVFTAQPTVILPVGNAAPAAKFLDVGIVVNAGTAGTMNILFDALFSVS